MEKITKEVLDENKELIIAGCVIGAALVFGVGGLYLYKRAFFKGAVAGFHGGIQWFDKNFEGLELREKFDLWEKLHPERMVYKA